MDEFSVTIGGREDLDLLTEHRLMMWKSIHPDRVMEIDTSREFTRGWIKEKLESHALVPFIVKMPGGSVVGSGCILVKEDQQRASSTKLNYPYLLSMYTLPEYRQMGVASLIVKEAIRWSIENGFDRISLHASSEGREVYEKLGFQQTNEMQFKLS